MTGKSGMTSIFFARPKSGKRFRFYKEILTKVVFIPIAFKTTIVMMICNTDIFFSNYYHLQSVCFELNEIGE